MLLAITLQQAPLPIAPASALAIIPTASAAPLQVLSLRRATVRAARSRVLAARSFASSPLQGVPQSHRVQLEVRLGYR